MGAAVLGIVVFFSIGTLLALWILIRSEANSTTVTDRTEAERNARDFGGRDDPPGQR